MNTFNYIYPIYIEQGKNGNWKLSVRYWELTLNEDKV